MRYPDNTYSFYLALRIFVSGYRSGEGPGEGCLRFWVRLRRAVILISSDRISASKRIGRMALIGALAVSTAAFEGAKEGFYGFWRTAASGWM